MTKNRVQLILIISLHLLILFQTYELYPQANSFPLIQITTPTGQHEIYYNFTSNTCTYSSNPFSKSWTSRFPKRFYQQNDFTITDPTQGPSHLLTYNHLNSSVSPDLMNSLPNTSYISSGFNLPINENNPGQYFWWLYPEQIRLSWTEREGEMRVTWVTYLQYSQQLAYRSILCKDNLNQTDWKFLQPTTFVFDEGQNMIRYQYIHSVIIPNLQPECNYEYLVGETCFWSDLFKFRGRTPYSNINETNIEKQVSMIVIGDWGAGILGTYSKKLLDEDLSTRVVDGIFHLGDFAYDLNDREGRQGDDWLNMVQSITSKVPYMTVPGNHEVDYNMTHYSNRFKMPINEANEGLGWFYSFNLGPAHFIMFNTEQYFEDGLKDSILTHKNWLISDLKQANSTRNQVPWIILLTHHSFYCSVPKSECLGQADILKADLEDLLNDYKVDIVFQAHVHNYERDACIYKEKIQGQVYDHYYLDPSTPVYIVNGNAGNYHGHNDPFPEVLPDFYIFGSQDYGYGRLQVWNKTHIYYEQFSSEQLTEIDYFWLINTRQD